MSICETCVSCVALTKKNGASLFVECFCTQMMRHPQGELLHCTHHFPIAPEVLEKDRQAREQLKRCL